MAQESTESGATPQSETGATGQVAEIIVTAQRRSENLQDVPIAVTSVTGSQLDAAGIESIVDLRAAAPALNSTA